MTKRIGIIKYVKTDKSIVTPGIRGVIALITLGLTIKLIKFIKKKKKAKIMKKKLVNIPIDQNIFQNLGNFLASFFMIEFNFLVFIIAISGKKT
jgi:hypothetical protein